MRLFGTKTCGFDISIKIQYFLLYGKMPKQTLNKESFAVFKMKDTASFFAQLKKKIQLIFLITCNFIL